MVYCKQRSVTTHVAPLISHVHCAFVSSVGTAYLLPNMFGTRSVSDLGFFKILEHLYMHNEICSRLFSVKTQKSTYVLFTPYTKYSKISHDILSAPVF
jgi:hypothetical protein